MAHVQSLEKPLSVLLAAGGKGGETHLAPQSIAEVGDYTMHQGNAHEVKEIKKLARPKKLSLREKPFTERVITIIRESRQKDLLNKPGEYYR